MKAECDWERHEVVDDFCSSKKRSRRITLSVASVAAVLILALTVKVVVSIGKGEDKVEGGIAKVLELEGKLLIKRSADTVPYEPDFVVREGDTFQTMENTTLKMEYLDDSTRLVLGENTTILINANAGGKKTNLAGGWVEYTVPKQPDSEPMVLQSYNAEATILEPGTYIQIFEGIATRFEVKKGHLRVRRFNDGKVVEVRSGETHVCQADDTGVITFQEDL
jgi:ferric-dicitrate binding protein FerR (iron transport regulator)